MRFQWRVLFGASLLVSCQSAEDVFVEENVPNDPAVSTDGSAEESPTRPPPAPRRADPNEEAARLTQSQPADGEDSFYPVEIFDQGQDLGVGERATLRFSFDRPMDDSASTVEIVGSTSRYASGTWSADRRTLEVVLLGTETTPPLEAEVDYEVRLDRLRTETNAAVAPTVVRFRTSARDSVVDHACIHTLYGPFATAVATAPGTTLADAPSVGNVHRQWTVDVPADGATFRGQVRVVFSGSGQRSYLLLLDRSVPLTLEEEGGGAVIVTAVDAVPACTGIRRVVSVTLTRGTTYRLTLGPSTQPTVKLVWEAL